MSMFPDTPFPPRWRAALCVLALAAAGIRQGSAAGPSQSSTLLYDEARARVWCVNQDHNSISAFDARSFARLREIPVGRNPRTLALDSLGRVWVANQDDATLSVVDGAGFAPVRTLALPRASRPYGICLDPRGGTAYVTLEGTGKLLRLDAATFAVTGAIDLFPSARALAVSPDGARILVTRYISPAYHGELADVRAEPFGLARVVSLAYEGDPRRPPGGIWGVPNALNAIAIAPDGLRAWVPFIKDNVTLGLFLNPGGPAPNFESTVRTGLTRIDLAAGAEEPAARSDFVDLSMADGVVCDHAGKFAYVSTSTGNAVSAFAMAGGGLRLRFDPEDPLRGAAPDGMALDPGDSLLFIHYLMDRAVGVYGVGRLAVSDSVPRLAWMPATDSETLPAAALRGKRVFRNAADPRMSLHRYISCAVCHLDGAADGRVWDLTHRGEGLRRTTSLLGKAGLGQGPLHWTANFDEVQDFEHDIRESFGGTGFLEFADYLAQVRDGPLGGPKAGLAPDLDALSDYLASLTQARPSPYRNPDGTLTPDAEAGKAIFLGAETGCAACHRPPRYTDSGPASGGGGSVPGGYLLHDVGTLNPGSGRRLGDTLTGFDTPTLLGLWESGPYLHDGSAATLMDVITTANAEDRHGHTSQLSQREREQLAAFLMQIEEEGPASGALPRAAEPPGRFRAARSAAGWRIIWSGPAESAGAALTVYDPSGRRLARLRPEPGSPARGPLAFAWPGRPRGPGVFLARLEWRGGGAVGRIMLE